ncbi:MAG: response regulator [Gemmatimonadota bacterium]
MSENRDILAQILRGLGIEVDVADSGPQALQRFASVQPHVVFLDIRMPGMDGIEALHRLRPEPSGAGFRAVAVSASVLEHERRAYLAAGFDAFLDKPFRIEDVCRQLAALLDLQFEFEAECPDRGERRWAGLAVPQGLLGELREAAELYSVTDIDDCLNRVAGLGAAPADLARHLRDLNARQDMVSILRILDEVEHGRP